MEAKDTLYEWMTTEYIAKKKTVDWYWAVGIIAVASCVAALIYKNFLFAVFVIIGALLLVMFEVKQPKPVRMRISSRGIMINEYIYEYSTLKSFWVDKKGQRLYLHSDRVVLPMISLPLGEAEPEKVKKLLSEHIKEEEVSPNSLSTIVDRMGL